VNLAFEMLNDSRLKAEDEFLSPQSHTAQSKNGTCGLGGKFRTAADLARSAGGEVSWVVKGLLARQAITELDGRAKAAGKTTFAASLVRQVLNGVPFLGRPTQKSRVVYLTEQTGATFREVLRRAGLLDREDLFVLPWHDTFGYRWPSVVSEAVAKADREGAGLLVVDTLPQFAGLRGDDENSAGAALEAVRPLQEAAAKGLAVLLLRHERKGGGAVGDSGRGSSAFAGAVDIILSLRRPEGAQRQTIRKLESLSRFDETPSELLIELVAGAYIALGTESDIAAQEARERILAVMSKLENTSTLDDLLLQMGSIKRTTAQRALDDLIHGGLIKRHGAGKKGDPYRFGFGDKESQETGISFGSEIHSAQTPTLGEGGKDRIDAAARRSAAPGPQRVPDSPAFSRETRSEPAEVPPQILAEVGA
jgi:hypothetical protein